MSFQEGEPIAAITKCGFHTLKIHYTNDKFTPSTD